MATKEFLLKRAEGKKKEIEKLEKQILRMEEAASTNWQVNPHYYNEHELFSSRKRLIVLKGQLKKYEDDIITIIEKENSRNIKVILDYLDLWYEKSVAFYLEARKGFIIERAQYLADDKSYCECLNKSNSYSKEEMDIKRKERNVAVQKFKAKWSFITQFNHGNLSWEDTMKNDLLIEKDGELNGYISGTRGKASVHTIGAGGYNVQCFHFRVLVKKLKS